MNIMKNPQIDEDLLKKINQPETIEKNHLNTVKYAFKSPYLYSVNRCGGGEVDKNFYIKRTYRYSFYVFHLVKKGRGLLIIDGEEYLLKKNDLFFIRPRQPHMYASSSADPLELMWVEFEEDNLSELITASMSPNIHLINIKDNDELLCDFESLVNYLKSKKHANPFKTSSYLYTLVCSFLDTISNVKTTDKDYPEWLKEAIFFISRNYESKLTVYDVASYIGYSTEHFSRCFSKYMGVSVAYYIKLLKIEKAINLLQDEKYAVKDIAEILCFTDSTHFIKTFKNVLGITPKKYREYF